MGGSGIMNQMKTDKLVMPCEVYSRVVGYYRPVQSWNEGKQEEFKDRKMFKISKDVLVGKE